MCSDRAFCALQFTCYRCDAVKMGWLRQHVQTRNGRNGEFIVQFLKKKQGENQMISASSFTFL